MADALSDSWWKVDEYEVVKRGEEGTPSLVIRPKPGATVSRYSVSEIHRDRGPSRAPYLELAHVGALLRDWYFREPYGSYNPDGSFRTEAQVEEAYGDLSVLTMDTMRQRNEAWLDEAIRQHLHEPVLDWCRKYGLLGAVRFDAVREQYARLGLPDVGAGRSAMDAMLTMMSNSAFCGAYEEPFTFFTVDAVQMEWILRAVKDPGSDARASSLKVLNSVLGSSLGLVVADEAGHVVPRWGSTSLFGLLAAMLVFDLAGGVRVGACDRCGKLFSTRREDKRTCSPRCQEALKKQRRRSDPDYRERELQRQRDARTRGPARG